MLARCRLSNQTPKFPFAVIFAQTLRRIGVCCRGAWAIMWVSFSSSGYEHRSGGGGRKE